MEDHFLKCGFNVWDNNWYDIYDFTPGGSGNFYYLPNTLHELTLLNENLSLEKQMDLKSTGSWSTEKSFIPYSRKNSLVYYYLVYLFFRWGNTFK